MKNTYLDVTYRYDLYKSMYLHELSEPERIFNRINLLLVVLGLIITVGLEKVIFAEKMTLSKIGETFFLLCIFYFLIRAAYNMYHVFSGKDYKRVNISELENDLIKNKYPEFLENNKNRNRSLKSYEQKYVKMTVDELASIEIIDQLIEAYTHNVEVNKKRRQYFFDCTKWLFICILFIIFYLVCWYLRDDIDFLCKYITISSN